MTEMIKCRVCGKVDLETNFEFSSICSKECFYKDFWDEKVRWKNKGDLESGKYKCARIKGRHYIIGDEPVNALQAKFLGFGGARWHIRFTAGPHKGEDTISHNVWFQGDIPQDYKELLPDNAELIND